jgi:hypothetical protein
MSSAHDRAKNDPTVTYSDAEIRTFVQDLESLVGGQLTASILVSCGDRAIPPLREYLLHGRPRGIYQPRQRAVEVLGELGAMTVLIEYLLQEKDITDPVVRTGEEAVKNTAARELSRWKTESVFEALSRAALKHLLPGIVEVLGEFQREESIPHLLRALGDDMCRSAAREALQKIGPRAAPALIEAAHTYVPSVEWETPSSLLRRRSVLRALANCSLSSADWPKLESVLQDKDPEIRVCTARIALQIAPENEKHLAIRRLIETLPIADWFIQTEIREQLVKVYSLARQQIEEEIRCRQERSREEQMQDRVLRMLIYVRRKADQEFV